MSKPKRAVILAGGMGSRLRPYTIVLPKPLMPIGEYPILEVVIRQLAQAGFEHITMAVNHQADIIKAFFNSGQKWNLNIDYSLENQALGTMGPLKLIRDLPEHFLVMNGDVLTDLDFDSFYNHHIKCRNEFTISSCLREVCSEFGVLDLNNNDTLYGFREKPVYYNNVSMGIYMVNSTILDLIPADIPYGFDNLMLDMIAKKRTVHVRQHSGYWLDIGRHDDYIQAIDMFKNNSDYFLLPRKNNVANPSI